MRQGLTGGSVAAIAAALVSLPLHSPNDALFSTITVVIGSLFVGLAGGEVWGFLASRPNPRRRFAFIWAVAFGASVLAMAVASTQLDRVMSFGAPLAGITFALTWAVTIFAAGFRPLRSWWTASAGLVVALALGLGLAGEGDQESGRLELPPPVSNMAIRSQADPGLEVIARL